MSDAQELRDKLGAVKKELQQVRAEMDHQRARHAREQKALQLALEKTRQEAARLRARIEPLETP
ncbi:periplakin [Stigmatella hybrida]|uniref:periplakin n=1 Tax=Stigmatella hybrida TaxID=394097 RepID=UPI001CDB0029|nr:periplakin [Stigmatella hybrida]